MNILYVSSLCSEKKVDVLSRTGNVKPEFAVQKFHKLLAEGFVLNDCEIETLSACPVSRSSHARIFWNRETEKNHGIFFHYLAFINYPFLRQITIFISGFLSTISWIRRSSGQEKMIICDILNVSVSASSLIAARLFRIKVVGIVTDLPRKMIGSKNKRKGLLDKMAPFVDEKLNNLYSFYVLLTLQMNKHINFNNRPSCIIEGVVDLNMVALDPEKEPAFRTIVYAGRLLEANGIGHLIEAFRQINGDDLRLSIFGSGEMEKEMEEFMKLDNRLNFYGTVSNAEVIQAELKATLLVNPRFTDAEFTKYSFPSKNLEYMVSGVPVLTTCLPGIPKDYYDYLYVVKDETVKGFVDALSAVFSLSDEELKSKGKLAKDFVLREKNNISQTRKILEMVRQ